MNFSLITEVEGLTSNEYKMLSDLMQIWGSRLNRNQTKLFYYEMKNELKNLGIAVPPELENFETASGWGAIVVDKLAIKSRFDGFTFEGGLENGLSDILIDNNFKLMYSQAVTNELIHSCVFITVVPTGNPHKPVSINFYSAESAAAMWDSSKKRIKCGMTIIETSLNPGSAVHQPTWVNLYTEYATIEIKKIGHKWFATRKPHSMDRPFMEAMVYRPALTRPFGKSRVSRSVMAIIDNAMRESLRTELAAEFLTTPQKYLIGASEEDFEKSRWGSYLGSLFVATLNDEDEKPEFGQLPQGTMQPHTEYMRNLAAQLSGVTSIPVSSFGIVHDNPSSAEAIHESKADLLDEVESLNDNNGAALCNVARMAMAIQQNTTVENLSLIEQRVKPRFRNPDRPALSTQADAGLKMTQALPYLAESDVILEVFQFSEDQITRINASKRESDARSVIDVLANVEAADAAQSNPL